MIDFNIVYKTHKSLISAYARIYGNGDYSDFRQELTIALWEYIGKKYDPERGTIDVFVGTHLKYLALNLLDKRRRNKQLSFENSFERLEEYLYYLKIHSVDNNLMHIIEKYLNDMQKKIVYILDSQGTDDNMSYKRVAKKLGIEQRMLYYYLSQIRSIIRRYVKYSVN